MTIEARVLAVLAFAICACRPGEAENPGRVEASAPAPRADTLHVYVHEVRAGRNADYERWVGDVWMAALRKAGEKHPEVRLATERQRLFARTEPGRDSSTRYFWLFEPSPPSSDALRNWEFPDSFLVAGGFSPQEAAAQAESLQAMVHRMEGGEAVRRF